MQAYFRRAEAIKLAPKNGEKLPVSCTVTSAIDNYKVSYELKQDFRTLQEAILFASENGIM